MILYAHQQAIIDADPKKTGLWLGTGSGKTRTALMLAVGTTLIVMPKTQFSDGNWKREAEYLHSKKARFTKLTFISKETFRRDAHLLPRFDTVIVDEAHTCLGVMPNTVWRKKVEIPKTSQLFEALDDFIARTKPERIYLCTATILRSPMTVWGAAKILGRVTDESHDRFRRNFYTRLPMPGRDVWSPRSDRKSKTELAAFVRKLGYVGRLDDYFDVPDQSYRTDYVELTLEQKQRIKDIKLEFPDPLVQIGKKHQIENGVLNGDEFNDLQLFKNAKLDKILDYALEFPRMIIFAKYTAQIHSINNALLKAGYRTWMLTGETKERGTVIKEANDNDGILICQAQISAGWELPQTPVMIFASRTYSFVDYDQALGRVQRANNIKKNLYINLVVRGGIDEAVDKALTNKNDFNERLYAGV